MSSQSFVHFVDTRPPEIGAALSAAAQSAGANAGDDNDNDSGSDIGDDDIGQAHTEVVVESFCDSVKFAADAVDAENGGGGTNMSLADNPLFPNTESRSSAALSSTLHHPNITLPSPKAAATSTTTTSVSDHGAVSAQQQLHPAALARQASAAGAAAFAAKRSGMLHVVTISQYRPH